MHQPGTGEETGLPGAEQVRELIAPAVGGQPAFGAEEIVQPLAPTGIRREPVHRHTNGEQLNQHNGRQEHRDGDTHGTDAHKEFG